MGEKTGISWTHHTFNPWMGCVKVSPACANCYAERETLRWGKELWGSDAPRQVTSDSYWKQPLRWNREAEKAGERRRVFCASLADVFEDRRDLDEHRTRLWNLIEETPGLDWLLLTKRPENVAKLAPSLWLPGIATGSGGAWPEHVWLGTTVESQEWANRRIPALVKIPARVRFLSCEPLLGPIDLTPWLGDWQARAAIKWVIVGGESGPRSREMKDEWVRSILAQCKASLVPFFMKQGFGNHPDKNPLIEGVLYREVPHGTA